MEKTREEKIEILKKVYPDIWKQIRDDGYTEHQTGELLLMYINAQIEKANKYKKEKAEKEEAAGLALLEKKRSGCL